MEQQIHIFLSVSKNQLIKKRRRRKVSPVYPAVMLISLCSGRIMKALANAGVPVPKVLDLCEDSRYCSGWFCSLAYSSYRKANNTLSQIPICHSKDKFG